MESTALAVFTYLYRIAYHRPFHPVVERVSVEDVVVDFDRPDSSRLQLGTFIIRNPEEVPWFGQWATGEQPIRHVPDSLRDMHSLRRHLYIDLSSQVYLRESWWREDPRLFIRKIQRGGEEVIVLRNSKGYEVMVGNLAAGVFIPTVPGPLGKVC